MASASTDSTRWYCHVDVADDYRGTTISCVIVDDLDSEPDPLLLLLEDV